MNLLPSLGSGFFSPQMMGGLLPAAPPQFPVPQKSPFPAAPAARDQVALSKAGISLSKQQDAMADRVDSLGNATVDMAQNFLTNFARTLFGDAANGMTIAFDSASVSASSSFSGMVQHSEGPDGSSDAAAFRLEDNASFIGKGVITTTDGHRFNFEVEVRYQAIVETAASRTTTFNRNPGQPGEDVGPSQARPPKAPAKDLYVDFPGTVADLFHMMTHNKLQSSFELPPAGKGDHAKQGSLTLRLLDLIESPSTINTKLAKAYGLSPTPSGPANAVGKTE